MDLNEFKKVVMERKKRNGDRYKMSYTTQERKFAVTFIHEKKAVGFSMLRISQELGVSQSTLIKWIKPGRKPGVMFRQVSVKKDFHFEGLVIVSPAGYRIEGVSLDSAVQILSRLK
jgi:hypothetical protein